MSTTTGADDSEGLTPATGQAIPGNKAEFILGLPRHFSAKEAVAEAKQQGIVITEKYVYKVRAAANPGPKPVKVARAKSQAKKAVPAAAKGKPGRKPRVANSAAPVFGGLQLASDEPGEQALIEAIRALGVSRSREVIAAIEKFDRATE